MSTFDDPNREAVGLEPIWTAPEVEPQFDPGAHTVADVEAYIATHPDQRDAVLAAERRGKNRTSLANLDEDDEDG